MEHPQIAACAERLGLTPRAWPALAELWQAAQREARSGPASVLTTLVEPLAPVTLDAGVTAPDLEEPPTEETEERTPAAAGDRYERLGLLGTGAMGEVWRVRDRDLNRTMAMKVIRAELMERGNVLARFIEEAQCSAQLQHPGIVPVHELGRLPGGEFYFTMREVRGRTLTEVIAEVHWASRGDRWQPSATGWTFRKLVDAFHRVCEAVAYAHSRGVVHRDLKPDNVMVGAHGEVLVVDWGLAKVVGRPDLAAEAGDLDAVVTDRSADTSKATRMGAVAGTPAYMPPEQARGDIDRIDARSDVYALGAILYEVLGGRPPYEGEDGMAVLRKVLAGPPGPVGRTEGAGSTFSFGFDEPAPAPATKAGPPLPEELVEALERAMARDPGERFAHAGELGAEVAAWLDGARLREQALDVVEKAQALGPEAQGLRERAAALRAEAAGLLADVDPWDPEEVKVPGWAKEDQAAGLERQAERTELRLEQGLYGALRIDARLPEAHGLLAERYLATHAAAEDARDSGAVARSELVLSEHVDALPEDHEVRQRCAVYLKGDGALSLVTDPPGAEVLLHRQEIRNRRLVPVFERSLGLTPLSEVTLPMGSYLCVLRHAGRAEVRYPVHIGRREHWDGVPPGASDPHSVPLPRPGDLAHDDCYVPPGWFVSGGDPDAPDSLPRRRLWSDGLVVKRFPVTNTEYIAFLDDLVARGREDEALRWVPRERAGQAGEEGAVIYGRDADGRFVLRADADGDVWLADWPVIQVNWHCAVAYCRWLAEQTGQPWRLPGELEWEKAARGVDGRFFPWGDVLDPSWACVRDAHQDRPLPAVVDSFPLDESVYGVRGMGGNVRDWCADAHAREGPPVDSEKVRVSADSEASASLRVSRGGGWVGTPRDARCASRGWDAPSYRLANLALRALRSFPSSI